MFLLDTGIVVAGAIRMVNCAARNRCNARPAEVYVSNDERTSATQRPPLRQFQSRTAALYA